MTLLHGINAIIFDLDGLLVDSEPIYRLVWQKACREFGYEMSDEQHLELLGRGRKGALEYVRSRTPEDFPIDKLEALLPLVEEQLFDQIDLQLKPGAIDLLEELSRRSMKRIIATSTNRIAATKRVNRTGLVKYFPHIVCGSDVARNKPAPDIFLHAAKLLSEPPSACLVVEDSEAGIQAAHAASMRVICIPDLKCPDQRVQALTAAVLESLADFKIHLRSNPEFA